MIVNLAKPTAAAVLFPAAEGYSATNVLLLSFLGKITMKN
jgi:hypothetical protein